ncbi:exonuclease [Natribaculum luteum]|uniref:Exonuclease n=1 Tax=Natribaculum luteum TaxID=1586232 RepID=A0ABD5NWP7_9EURY|nr:exonuclease [Natribaculum luteum]
MSTTGRPAALPTAALESAGFVRIVSRADGDALAAVGIVARALAERETPFQAAVRPTVGSRTDRVAAADDTTETLAIGAIDGDAHRLAPSDRPTTLAACDLSRELGVEPDPVLALAGAFAAGVEPGAGETEHLLETARDRGLLERRPGVAIPTDDVADLAYSTLCRAPWSGDSEATTESLADLDFDSEDLDSEDLDDETWRRVGSLVALEAVGDEPATESAAHAIGRVLNPHATPEGPFATVGGYADVLEATALVAPGTGVALAIGHDASESALEAWREHGRRAHDALDGASTGRYDGLFVVGVDDGPVETVASVAARYRSPEPFVLAIGEGEAGIATLEARSLGGPLEAVSRELEADYDVGRRRGYLQYDPEMDDSTIIATVRDRL